MTQMLSLDAHPEVVTPTAASANGAPPAPVLLAVDANAIVLAGPDPHAQAQEAIALAAELAHAVPAPQVGMGPALPLLDRDLSILAFNERVLSWAERKDVPLLERLRYLCIVSSNLDEWFEVRSAPHVAVAQTGEERDSYTRTRFAALMDKAQALVAHQYHIYNQALIPAFHTHGIRLISHGERNAAQRRWVHEYFLREVQPLLVPVGLDPSHPFPQVANKALNFIVRLDGVDAFGRANEVAIVKVPRALPRLIPMPQKIAGKQRLFVSISSIVRAHLAELFPGREVTEFSQFRVTRNSDLAVDEEDVINLRMALRQGLHHRHYGQAVRLEVSASCSAVLANLLLQQHGLPQQALFRVKGPVNLVRQMQLIDLVDDPALLFSPWKPAWPRQLVAGRSVMEQMRKGDVLIHQPFEDFDAVLELLREAVNDPQVLAIKQTIYRTGSDSEIMRLLAEAVGRGKEVLAVLELKARFDEEANINWAEKLESLGVQVVYGVVGLKTHAKMLLITRRDKRTGQLQRYGHLSTGNYNARSARLYTDLSHLTCDAAITEDMDAVFRHLSSPRRPWWPPGLSRQRPQLLHGNLPGRGCQGQGCPDTHSQLGQLRHLPWQRRQARHQHQDLYHLQRYGHGADAPGLLQRSADLPALPRHRQDHSRALHQLRRPGQGQASEDPGSEDSSRHRRRHAHPLSRQRRARHQWWPGGRSVH